MKEPTVFPVESLGQSRIRVERNQSMNFHTHSHVYFEMLYYQPFAGTLTINGQSFSVPHPTAILITPNDFHSTQVTAPAEYIKLCCCEDLLGNALPNAPYILTDDSNGLLAHLFAAADRNRNNRDYVIAIMQMVVVEMMTNGERLPSPSVHKNTTLVSKTLGILNQEFSRELSLSSVAERLHVTPQHLSSVFSQTAGITFQEYLTNRRLNYAASLLLEPDKSVTEICYISGYRNFSHFIRSFKKKFGVSPGEYRSRR